MLPSSQEAYQYDELPRGDVFRYLLLQPGINNEPLRCSLYTATLSETRFEALSYVWGSNIKNQEIACDGLDMNITTNLSKALRRLRLSDAPRRLWADSICINQEDLEEKGHQVAIMGQIYRMAERVLIYIGSDEGGHGPHVCSLLEEVNEMIEETCKHIDMSWDSFPYPDKDDTLLVDARWESLHKLLSRNWFDRGWVVREAALGQCCQVIWGQSVFTWKNVMRAYIWLKRRAPIVFVSRRFLSCGIALHQDVYEQRHKDFAQAFWGESTWRTASILTILDLARDLQLSDPRDRIYAFTELSGDSLQELDICPNYKESHLEVYRQFAIQYIRSTTNVEILDYVGNDTSAMGSNTPSWIPRWDISLSLGTNIPSGWSALRPHTMPIGEPIVVNDSILKVGGVIIDTVRYVSNVLTMDTTTPATFQDIWKSVNMLTEDSPYTASHRIDAFLDTLSRICYF